MKTAHKIALARTAYQFVHLCRKIVGLSDSTVVKRGDAIFELDLAQGLDFAIYLGDIFERGTKKALRRLVTENGVVLDIGANIGAHTQVGGDPTRAPGRGADRHAQQQPLRLRGQLHRPAGPGPVAARVDAVL